MKGFISHIVDQLPSDDLDKFHKYAFVFPSRRACYYFREALLERFPEETFWVPNILSIEDFIVRCTGKSISNEIDLLFALYAAYSDTYLPPPEGEIDKEELPTFDRFYAWGQVLLKDFDEVDRHLVNAREIYRNLDQLQQLESRYQDNEEVLFALKRFNEMMGNEPTTLTVNFINQWSRVSKTYHSYKNHLNSNNLYYSGMLYRQLAEQLANGSINVPFDKVVFAGFNALSKSEEVIIGSLLTNDAATIYWDADRLYMEHEVEEAGKFMRRNYKKWPPSEQVHWVITDMLKEPKRIQLIGGVQAVGQAQVVGQLLAELSEEQQQSCGVVLADEGLLFPLLFALPENIQSLNVTMGYPTKHSHWFGLANAYMEYQLHLRGKAHNAYAEASYVTDLISNPLMQRALPSLKQFSSALNTKSKWVAVSAFIASGSPETLKLAMTPKDRVSDLISSLVELMMSIYQKLRLDQQLGDLETEFAYHSLKHLMQLEERIQKQHQQLEPRTLARLIIQVFEQLKIPFSGEPTKGLQLMGFLETRALDFERVILVSANEGKLPRGNRHTSYIPYAIRKAFKLPTFEEQDAIYAYHFKRVLQRAKDIIVLYNTEVAIDGSGEKSRFIWQLIESFPKESISQHVYQMSLSKSPASATLDIQKSSKVVEMMQRFLVGIGEEKSLSPTAIRHYLDCSLRFYFRYLVRIREREKESKELDPRDFGNIVHHGLERLYQPLTGETVSRDRIKELLDSQVITEAVDWAIKNHFKKSYFSVIEGKDLLHEQIIQKLIYKVVEKDLREAPFTLTGTEIRITSDLEFSPGKVVRLEGTLDRVHTTNETHHIVDYKTGKADLKNLNRPVFPEGGLDYVQTHFDEPRFKSGFQSLFYGYLWDRARGGTPVKLGVYPLKKVNEGIQWLNHGQVIPPSGFKEFERLLITTLKELYDETVPFTQTDDTDRCRYCAYKEICQR